MSTVGDDICWMRPGDDGRLYAINPEAGFFGVAPGTSASTNPNALRSVSRDTIFTNVAVTGDNQPWWEGLPGTPAIDWQGRPYDPANGPAAHPNSRFTVSAKQCPTWSEMAEAPGGVPISAIVFGGRRPSLLPLVMEARDWSHGVLMGAAMGSETTAAATGAVGVLASGLDGHEAILRLSLRRLFRPLALVRQAAAPRLPRIFHVNWFRKGADGKFLWPGFGENLRVLAWMIDRVEGRVPGAETAIGVLPAARRAEPRRARHRRCLPWRSCFASTSSAGSPNCVDIGRLSRRLCAAPARASAPGAAARRPVPRRSGSPHPTEGQRRLPERCRAGGPVAANGQRDPGGSSIQTFCDHRASKLAR